MKQLKRLSRKHVGDCLEEPWGSDFRFTICVLCGKQRYYPNEWRAPAPKPSEQSNLDVDANVKVAEEPT